MTISKDADVFEIYGQRKTFSMPTTKMKRQKSFDHADDSSFGLTDTEVSRSFIENVPLMDRKDSKNRRSNRSSLIFDWLSDPENPFMFQDGSPDGHVFRSNSAVQARPSAGFIKNNLYSSLREQDSNVKENALNKHGTFKGYKIENRTETEPSINNELNSSFVESRLKQAHNVSSVNNEQTGSVFSSEIDDVFVASNDEEEETFSAAKTQLDLDINDAASAENGLFCAEDENKNYLEKSFDEMSIDKESLYCDDRSRSTSYSLPNFSKPKRRGKLRRINSDALFYKDRYLDGDKRRGANLGSKKRKSSSFQLKNLSVNDKTIGEQLKELEDIILRGAICQVRQLAECGFDFNDRDGAGNCALHYAAMRGNEEIITEILDNGGSVWIRNSKNQLPVELASTMNVRMLLSRVTLFYREQYSGQTESHLTCKGMSFEL